MSLNWDVAEVLEYQKKKGPRLDNLIWGLMAIGISKITADNVDQVYARLNTYETLFGAFMYKTGSDGKHVDWPYEKSDIVDYIGLRTNVSVETKTQFKNKIIRRIMDENDGKNW